MQSVMVVVLNLHVAAVFYLHLNRASTNEKALPVHPVSVLFWHRTETPLCTVMSDTFTNLLCTTTCAPNTQTYPQTYTPQQADQYLSAAHSGREGDQQGEVKHLHHSREPDPRPQLSLLHRLQHHQHRATGYHGCQTPSHPGPAVASHQGTDLGVCVSV